MAFQANSKPIFDQMSDDPDLYLDDVQHKAIMEVTEEGTVAAAVTVGKCMILSTLLHY